MRRLGVHDVDDRMGEVGGLAALLARGHRDPADLVEIALLVGRPGGAVMVAELPAHRPDAVMVGEGPALLERVLDVVPGHRRVVGRRRFVAGHPVEPLERLLHRLDLEEQLASLGVLPLDAEGGEGHQIVGPDIGAVELAELGPTLVDHLLHELAPIRGRDLAAGDLGGNAVDELLGLADLPEHVLVVEDHADLGVLRDRVDLPLILRRVPQYRDDVAEGPLVVGDDLVQIHRIAVAGELADPLVRGHIEVGALVHRERLEERQRVGVEPVGIVLVDVDLDPRVGAGRRQHLVELLAGGDDVAAPERAGPVGPGPHLDRDLLRPRRRDGCAKRRRPRAAAAARPVKRLIFLSPVPRARTRLARPARPIGLPRYRQRRGNLMADGRCASTRVTKQSRNGHRASDAPAEPWGGRSSCVM